MLLSHPFWLNAQKPLRLNENHHGVLKFKFEDRLRDSLDCERNYLLIADN